jgi:hypothetical protein
MMTKIIFLDIDGVLNSFNFFKSEIYLNYHKAVNEEIESFSRSKEIDKEAIKVLNNIILQTDAKIVISSTWRKAGISVCKEELYSCGLISKSIIGITPCGCSLCLRGNEILTWIKSNELRLGINSYHDYTNYIILDDDSDMLYWQRNNFIYISSETGLIESHIPMCVKVLNQ